MRKIFLLMIVLVLLLPVSAISMDSADIFENKLDENSPEFKSVEAVLSSGSMIADYRQTKHIQRFNRNLVSNGIMMLKSDNGMVWMTEKPYSSVMLVGKDALKQQIAGGKVITQNVEGNTIYVAIAEAMENVFSGQFSLIHDVFDAYFLMDGATWYIGLVPRSDEFSSFVSYITISGKEFIECVFMKEVGGNSILYEFDNVELRELYAEEEKVFSI